ncbi:hypothetical protein DX910_13590 [Acinetobacter haemolyticus]|nr:hypothetical protein DX910_13535 [Acinetobacter haemolyticus]AZN69124.1 hypothetical protein DX910_13590 [Acinetobacter haemolyticus]
MTERVVKVYPKQEQLERIVNNLSKISSNLRNLQSEVDQEDHEKKLDRQIEYIALQMQELKSLYETKA